MIFWRGKEGFSAPENAQFFLFPFEESSSCLPFPQEIKTLPSPTQTLRLKKRTDLPDFENWKKLVEKTLQKKAVQKVVLARKTTLEFEEEVDPFQLAASLEKKRKGAALFCCKLPDGRAFLGASPERLFQREGKNLMTEAVAGTTKKGEKNLLESAKELSEHRFVQKYLAQKLGALSEEPIHFSEVTLHETATVEHLFSQAKAKLIQTDDLALIRTLHPSPAVCGTPTSAALRWIHKEEPFAREFYAGVIGWTNQESSEWMVAIRSCLVEGHKVHLYAGAGIVQGSDPEKEWEELEAKISLYEEICPLS